MDLLRIFIDGLMMSAWFNLATGMLLAINPVIFTTSFPRELQKAAPPNPHALRDKGLFTLLVILPVVLFGSLSAWMHGLTGFWTLFRAGYAQWFLVNLGDFFGLDLLLREHLGDRCELPGTHGHPCYERKNWMKSLGIPEHFLLWPLGVCPLMGLIMAGIGMLLAAF